MKTTIDQKNNAIIFPLSLEVYTKQVIYKACYVFIDRMYIFLEAGKKNELVVTLKGKENLKKNDLVKLEGEFMNEMLNSLVRENVSKRNQKILEQIVGGAMGAALGINEGSSDQNNEEAKEIEEAVAALKIQLAEIESSSDYENDNLGIRQISSSKNSKKKTRKK